MRHPGWWSVAAEDPARARPQTVGYTDNAMVEASAPARHPGWWGATAEAPAWVRPWMVRYIGGREAVAPGRPGMTATPNSGARRRQPRTGEAPWLVGRSGEVSSPGATSDSGAQRRRPRHQGGQARGVQRCPPRPCQGWARPRPLGHGGSGDPDKGRMSTRTPTTRLSSGGPSLCRCDGSESWAWGADVVGAANHPSLLFFFVRNCLSSVPSGTLPSSRPIALGKEPFADRSYAGVLCGVRHLVNGCFP